MALAGCSRDLADPGVGSLHGVASVALVVLGIVVARRGRAAPIAPALGLLCAILAVWNAALAFAPWWGAALARRLASVSMLLSAPVLSAFARMFTGRYWSSPRTRTVLLVLAGLCVLWGAGVLVAGERVLGLTDPLPDLALAAASLDAAWMLTQRLRAPPSAQEETRARIMAAALVLGGTLGVTELAGLAGLAGPHLGALAAPASLGIAALVVLRVRVGDRDVSTLPAAYGAAIGACAVVAYLAVFQLSQRVPMALAPGTVAVTLALLAAMREGVAQAMVERQRLEQLATLGRFAAQLAHDLKNPLTALKGAAQFLKEEHTRRGTAGDDDDFLELMLEEIGRMQRVVDNYQRLGRVEPERASVAINEVVRGVMALQSFAGAAGVEVHVVYGEGLPTVQADADLLANTLKNLVRNAFEAMPRSGVLTVRTDVTDPSEDPGVVITVEDTGVGMTALTRERALESFYTTKAQGSGLGLAFARRVMEAHGGALTLTSREGIGTIVRLRLPR